MGQYVGQGSSYRIGLFIMNDEEFKIEAFKTNESGREITRIWTRDKLSVAKFIADSAVEKLGYSRAEVRNTFGGDVSNLLYKIEAL